MQALWSNEHALAWHLGQDFQADPVAWARKQCQAWEELEDQLPDFLVELPDCPCTLAQARADSGRFHVSPLRPPPKAGVQEPSRVHVGPGPHGVGRRRPLEGGRGSEGPRGGRDGAGGA